MRTMSETIKKTNLYTYVYQKWFFRWLRPKSPTMLASIHFYTHFFNQEQPSVIPTDILAACENSCSVNVSWYSWQVMVLLGKITNITDLDRFLGHHRFVNLNRFVIFLEIKEPFHGKKLHQQFPPVYGMFGFQPKGVGISDDSILRPQPSLPHFCCPPQKKNSTPKQQHCWPHKKT